MLGIVDLWLPLLLSAVFVFLVSFVTHMVLRYHRSDYVQLPGEAEILEGIRAQGVGRGDYMFPHCDDMKDLQSEAMLAKFNQGPVGLLTIMPNGPWNMGKSLLQWFIFCIVVSAVTAYLASIAFARGPATMDIFRFTATAPFLAYGIGLAHNSIWKATFWSVTAKFVFDGLLYGLSTGATFYWFWPAVETAA